MHGQAQAGYPTSYQNGRTLLPAASSAAAVRVQARPVNSVHQQPPPRAAVPQPTGSHSQPEPSFSAEPPAGSMIARIHGNGLLGYVLLTPDTSGARRTVIRARLTGPSSKTELFNWKIHSFPQQLSSVGCSSIAIGPVLHDLSQAHGPLQVSQVWIH